VKNLHRKFSPSDPILCFPRELLLMWVNILILLLPELIFTQHPRGSRCARYTSHWPILASVGASWSVRGLKTPSSPRHQIMTLASSSSTHMPSERCKCSVFLFF
jgi:hypothetical protein